MGKIRQVPSAIRGWNTERYTRRFASKRYTRDEDDGEDAFAGCIWRGMTTSSRTRTVLLEDVQSVPRCIIRTSRMLTRRGVHSRAVFISLSASNCAAFIRGRRLFAEIRYILCSAFIYSGSLHGAAQYNEQMHAHAGTEVPHCALGVNCHT